MPLARPATLLAAASVVTAGTAVVRQWKRRFGRRCDAPVTAAPAAIGSDGDNPSGGSDAPAAPLPLTPAMVAQFRERGFLVVRGVVSERACAAAQAACERLVDEEAAKLVAAGRLSTADARRLADAPFSRRLFELYAAAGCVGDAPLLFRDRLHKQGFQDVFCNERLITAVRQLIPKASAVRVFPNYSCRGKLPKLRAQVVAWHQDAGLRPDGGPNRAPVAEREEAFGVEAMVNAWMPLVEATRANGAMKFVPESHKLGCVRHVVVGEYRDRSVSAVAAARKAAAAEASGTPAPAGTFSTGIDPAVVAQHSGKFVWVECLRGDVVLFNNLLFHSAGDNTSDGIRWSFDWRYQDASKKTHRPQQGHVVFAEDDPAAGAATRARWAELALS